MKLIVKNKVRAISEDPGSEPHVIISIYTPRDDPPKVKTNSNTVDILQLAFDDLDRVPEEGSAITHVLSNPVLFDSDMAEDIAEFIERSTTNTVICHCDAGISRSAGVAAALSKFFNGTDEEYFRLKKIYEKGQRYCPNRLVYLHLLNVLHCRNTVV